MMDDGPLDGDSRLSGISWFREGVSVEQRAAADEDDWLYYIPERRPSLDLGPTPMETSHWHIEEALSPALSYTSMMSEEEDREMYPRDLFRTSVKLIRNDSFSTSCSLDSDCEKKLKDVEDTAKPERPELLEDPSEIRHPSLTLESTFKAILKTLKMQSQKDIRTFQRTLWQRYPQITFTASQEVDLVDLVDGMLEGFSLEVCLRITKIILEEMKMKKLADYLQNLLVHDEIRYDLREILKRKYGEGSPPQSDSGPPPDAISQLFITSTSNNGPNAEHEVLTVQRPDGGREAGKPISTEDFFSKEELETSNNNLTFVTGVAGSGKSTAARKLILDWAAGRSHPHVSFLFPLPFRELKRFAGVRVSLLDIVHTLYPEAQRLSGADFGSDDCRMLFVLDGLDEFGKLDFENTEILFDHASPSSLSVIVVNILRQKLLFSGLFVVTSRLHANACLPWDTHFVEREVRGFDGPEIDRYFQRMFGDPAEAAAIMARVNSSKTLRIMCHLPLFCSLMASEWRRALREAGPRAEPPGSVTYMCTRLVLELIRRRRAFRAPERGPDEERDFIMKLGEVALAMLERGHFQIGDGKRREHRVSVEEAVARSGLCTRHLTRRRVLYADHAFSFIHPTVQEYLAALYAFLSFVNHGKNVLEQKERFLLRQKTRRDLLLYKSAVDRSLPCRDGKMDIFLRFLCGLLRQANWELVRSWCTASPPPPSPPSPPVNSQAVAAILRKRIKENKFPGRVENLQRCLEELGVQEASSS